MMIEIKRNAENTIVELVGRLDTTTAPSLEKMLNEAGLTVIKKTADTDFSPLSEESARCFFICKKVGTAHWKLPPYPSLF